MYDKNKKENNSLLIIFVFVALSLTIVKATQAQNLPYEKAAIDVGEVAAELYMLSIVCEDYTEGASEYIRELDGLFKLIGASPPNLWAAYEVKKDVQKKSKRTAIKTCKGNLNKKIKKYDAVREAYLSKKPYDWPSPPLIVNLD